MDTGIAKRFELSALRATVLALLEKAGLQPEAAQAVTQVLLDADLIGHATHGLALVPWYLEAARSGAMQLVGAPEVVSDRGACVVWNGHRLPGAWLASKAVDLAIQRADTYGTATLVIRDCGHVGALAAYMARATERGMLLLMASSTPSVAGVAPFGGRKAVFTPNPIAAGIPTEGDPILLDISASITTLNRARQLAREGRSFPSEWVLDKDGSISADPAVVVSQGGSLLPVGGLDHGHKGYSLALLVEALTQGLSGFGRADAPSGTSVSLFVQVLDPSAFGGSTEFTRQTAHLAAACRDTPPVPGVDRVRVPGDRAAQAKKSALEHGVPLDDAILTGLQPWLDRYEMAMPAPLDVNRPL
ncbi:L-lactate dehydrogenase [Acidovorax delafieldii]|uniref:L-lactate dehydrogenase n=1 Tax=Acidovorax delafieldii TaxID=47920 RepID=A0A561XHP2_ACIDE|nr:Ldh family oxidoreductase [Acidovorax delafieldii]TWG35659.1 L-lactate dehydrogenase [Acidovorax delafieldii]